MSISDPQSSHILVSTYQHPFPLDLNRAALLVIDIQNAFCNLESFCGNELGADLSNVRAIIPRLVKVIAWARKHGLLIIYTRESHLPDMSDVTPSKKQRYINFAKIVSVVSLMMTI